MSRLKQVILIIVVLFSLPAWAEQTENFLAISDIHFDPFLACGKKSPCELITKLQQAPASEWQRILSASATQAQQYRQDTNFRLLHGSLSDLQALTAKEKIQFVLLMGDLLAHGYRDKYNYFARDPSEESYRSFVKKTYEFLTLEFNQAFPAISVFPVIGNNDTYQQHYASEPKGPFFQDVSEAWQPLLKNISLEMKKMPSFTSGGYYSIDYNKKLKLILLNSVLFSHLASGPHIDQAAREQINWLTQQLEQTINDHKKALIVMHIPTGIDVYASLHQTPFKIIGHFKPEYQLALRTILQNYSENIIAILASHLHRDSFVLVKLGQQEIAELLVPAISPLTGNNASVKIFQLSHRNLKVYDAITYIYPQSGLTGWQKEYSFNDVYQPGCADCDILTGMNNLQKTGILTEYYQKYYAQGQVKEAIKEKWLPYYWCTIQSDTSTDYQQCMEAL